MTKYVIFDGKHVIADFADEGEATEAFKNTPNEAVSTWVGDLVLAKVIAVRR